MVLAASNLITVLDTIAGSFSVDYNIPVRVIYGPSSVLAAGLEYGLKADVFFSVGRRWMDRVRSAGVLQAGTETTCLRAIWFS